MFSERRVGPPKAGNVHLGPCFFVPSFRGTGKKSDFVRQAAARAKRGPGKGARFRPLPVCLPGRFLEGESGSLPSGSRDEDPKKVGAKGSWGRSFREGRSVPRTGHPPGQFLGHRRTAMNRGPLPASGPDGPIPSRAERAVHPGRNFSGRFFPLSGGKFFIRGKWHTPFRSPAVCRRKNFSNGTQWLFPPLRSCKIKIKRSKKKNERK